MVGLTTLIIGEHAILRIPKNASSAMQALQERVEGSNITLGGQYPDQPIHAFIRDPIERFYSCALNLGNRGTTPYYPPALDYSGFVDNTFLHRDDHWNVQAELVAGVPNLVLHRYEDLHKVWSALGLPPLPHTNVDGKLMRPHQKVLTAYRREELVAKYQGDFDLRKKLEKNNGS